jgi:hypothetical protein
MKGAGNPRRLLRFEEVHAALYVAFIDQRGCVSPTTVQQGISVFNLFTVRIPARADFDAGIRS